MLGLVGQMGVADGGENGVMAENLLHFDQVNTGFDQVRGVTVAKAVGGDVFFRPQALITLCKVV